MFVLRALYREQQAEPLYGESNRTIGRFNRNVTKYAMKKLFVGNLPYKTTDADLRDMFSKNGEVTEAVVIMDRERGVSKGFGFVTMTNDAEANAAIDAWNGKDIEGRALTVNEARPQEARPRRDNFRR
ncbi:MAG: RNA-binding protein [Patescibacteria group bacterium]